MVVDTSAVLAILFDEPEGGGFRDLLLDAGGARMSMVSVVETGIVALGRGRPGHARAMDLLDQLLIEQVPLDAVQTRLAVEAYGDWGRKHHRASLNFGDCFSYALAKTLDAPLLFKGDDFARTGITPAVPPNDIGPAGPVR
jgi:ribonuclease VapC